MLFKEFYFVEQEIDLSVGDTVHIKDDKTAYIIKGIDGELYELVDKDTKRKNKAVTRKAIVGSQLDMFGGESSTKKKKVKQTRTPRKKKESEFQQLDMFG
jgi:hypothetical protein